MTRECPVRFCERLVVKLLGATLPPGTMRRSRETLPQADLSFLIRTLLNNLSIGMNS
jgi:hypothetical protein